MAMMIPSMNTFIHFGADFDSDFEEEEPQRKWKSEPKQRVWSDAGSNMHTLPSDQMSTVSSFPCSTEKTKKLMGSLPSAWKCQYGRDVGDPVFLKNTFIHVDDKEADCELPMQGKFRSDPGRADAPIEEDSHILEEYGATLRSRAARLQESHQDTSQKRTHKVVNWSDTTTSQEWCSNAQVAKARESDYQYVSMDHWKGVAPGKVVDFQPRLISEDKMSMFNNFQALGVNMTERSESPEPLQSVFNDEYEREFGERFNSVPKADYMRHIRSEYARDLTPADASIKEELRFAGYGARAPGGLGWLGAVTPQLSSANTWHSNAHVAKALQQNYARRGAPMMASPPSWMVHDVDPNDDPSQAQAEPELVSREVTTLMVCNLPCKISSSGLTQVVNKLGFEGLYDLIYVPRGAKNSMGYGFVNFINPYDAARFCGVIGTYNFPGNSKKRAYCKVAENQGAMSNLEKISRGSNYRKRAEVPVIR